MELVLLKLWIVTLPVNRKEVEQLLHVGQTMAGRILKEMVIKGQLITEGKAAKTKYFLA